MLTLQSPRQIMAIQESQYTKMSTTAKFTPSFLTSLKRTVRTAINECNDIIPKDTKWKYINLNPSTPTTRGLIKIHKIDSPIRPIINCKNAPA